MKTIKILKVLINILYILLLVVLGVGVLFLTMLLFFDDSLPIYLQVYKILFSPFFNWKLFLIPFATSINYILFILSIFYLRKCIKPFIASEFYVTGIYKNLRKSGSLFIFIGTSTILFRIIAALYMNSIAQNMIQGSGTSTMYYISFFLSSFDLPSVFLIIIGLFFLLFSNSFENARRLQQENDLTIKL